MLDTDVNAAAFGRALTHLPHGTSIAALGGIRVRVIDAQITLDLGSTDQQRTGRSRP